MADPVLHIKDSYYFEVPKMLQRSDLKSLDEVPEYLREAHPETTLEEFNQALHGKILIPQPFGTPANHHDAASGFCISKFMIIEVVVAIILVLIFTKLAKLISTGERPRGIFWNMFESVLLYVRDHIARPAIGLHDADKFVPLLWTIFFFVLFCNLFGLLPWAGSPTGAFGVTLTLAFVIFGAGLIAGMQKFGPVGYWFNQVPTMDLPWYVAPLKLLIFAIEVLGMFIKHAVLGIRLLANMVAGHLVLLGIMGLIAAAAAAPLANWSVVATIGILGSTIFSILELFVSFLQAYIFTFLSALFIGASVHHH